jgi:hypothetical protein
VHRYRFGLATADSLLSRRCGVYLGATMATPTRSFGIINVRTLDAPGLHLRKAVPMDYGDEDVATRRARRVRRWTPVTAT